MHLIDENVRHALELRVALEPLSNTPVVQKSRRVLSQILDSPRMAYPIAP